MYIIKTLKRFIAANLTSQKYDPAWVKEFENGCGSGQCDAATRKTFSFPHRNIKSGKVSANKLSSWNIFKTPSDIFAVT